MQNDYITIIFAKQNVNFILPPTVFQDLNCDVTELLLSAPELIFAFSSKVVSSVTNIVNDDYRKREMFRRGKVSRMTFSYTSRKVSRC